MKFTLKINNRTLNIEAEEDSIVDFKVKRGQKVVFEVNDDETTNVIVKDSRVAELEKELSKTKDKADKLHAMYLEMKATLDNIEFVEEAEAEEVVKPKKKKTTNKIIMEETEEEAEEEEEEEAEEVYKPSPERLKKVKSNFKGIFK